MVSNFLQFHKTVKPGITESEHALIDAKFRSALKQVELGHNRVEDFDLTMTQVIHEINLARISVCPSCSQIGNQLIDTNVRYAGQKWALKQCFHCGAYHGHVPNGLLALLKKHVIHVSPDFENQLFYCLQSFDNTQGWVDGYVDKEVSKRFLAHWLETSYGSK